MLRRFAEVSDGTFVWVRGESSYFLGRVAGPWRYDDSPAAHEVGIHHVRPTRGLDRPFGEHDVPAAVAATFARGGRNLQRIHGEAVERQTAELWQEAQREPSSVRRSAGRMNGAYSGGWRPGAPGCHPKLPACDRGTTTPDCRAHIAPPRRCPPPGRSTARRAANLRPPRERSRLLGEGGTSDCPRFVRLTFAAHMTASIRRVGAGLRAADVPHNYCAQRQRRGLLRGSDPYMLRTSRLP
jgi:hypothetical protein